MSGSVLRLRIPTERVGVLIGSEGGIKKAIESRLEVRLDVDGNTGNIGVVITQNSNPADAFRARDIVMAIGRGFSPENALHLFDEDVNLTIVDLREYFGRSISDTQRVKGRIIGVNGKTRRNLEEYTGTKVSVYGHTVSIIGDMEHSQIAKDAIELLIRGSMHKSVYRFLESKRGELKKSEAEIWKTSFEKTR